MLIACQGCRLCGHRYFRCYQSRGVHQRYRCCSPNAYYGHCLAVAYVWLAQKEKAYAVNVLCVAICPTAILFALFSGLADRFRPFKGFNVGGVSFSRLRLIAQPV